MINSIGGIIIWTQKDSFTKMVEFYSQILDLKIHSEKEGFVVFSWGDMRLSLGIHSELSKKYHDPLRIMVNFLTEDIELSLIHI